jgi:predicted transcriptional regulator
MKTIEKISNLRLEGKSYNEISKILEISKATVSYHSRKLNMNNPVKGNRLGFTELNNLINYYKDHTIKETAEFFKVSESTVKRYGNKKMIKYTEEENKVRNYIRLKDRRQQLKKMGVEYLGGKCIVCGYDKCIWALQFHHRNPKEKDFTISTYSNLGWEKIKKELNKCDLLCSNCHDELHYNEYISGNIPSV